MDSDTKKGGYEKCTQVLCFKNRVTTSYLPNQPEPGCSPLHLLNDGKFIASEEDFKVLRPHLQHLVQV